VLFQADYEEVKLQKIVMTLFHWCHYYYVTEKTSPK